MSVSIIIPTLNESERLGATLASVAELKPAPQECIVVDGHSDDNTAQIARDGGAHVVSVPVRRRSFQLHHGAIQATGDILVFLHADTFLPRNSVSLIEETLAEARVSLGGFRSVMVDDNGRVQRFTTWHNAIKTYYAPMLYRPWWTLFRGLRLLFGDQVMFCRRVDYFRAGGFDPDIEIMEEADLCLKLNRFGRIRQLQTCVFSSDRRVARVGSFHANLLFVAIALGWALGVSPRRLRGVFDRM